MHLSISSGLAMEFASISGTIVHLSPFLTATEGNSAVKSLVEARYTNATSSERIPFFSIIVSSNSLVAPNDGFPFVG